MYTYLYVCVYIYLDTDFSLNIKPQGFNASKVSCKHYIQYIIYYRYKMFYYINIPEFTSWNPLKCTNTHFFL